MVCLSCDHMITWSRSTRNLGGIWSSSTAGRRVQVGVRSMGAAAETQLLHASGRVAPPEGGRDLAPASTPAAWRSVPWVSRVFCKLDLGPGNPVVPLDPVPVQTWDLILASSLLTGPSTTAYSHRSKVQELHSQWDRSSKYLGKEILLPLLRLKLCFENYSWKYGV